MPARLLGSPSCLLMHMPKPLRYFIHCESSYGIYFEVKTIALNNFNKFMIYQVIPRQLCDNAGFDATDVLNKLRQKHASGRFL